MRGVLARSSLDILINLILTPVKWLHIVGLQMHPPLQGLSGPYAPALEDSDRAAYAARRSFNRGRLGCKAATGGLRCLATRASGRGRYRSTAPALLACLRAACAIGEAAGAWCPLQGNQLTVRDVSA